MQKSLQKINKAFSGFENSNIIPVASDGEWSMHHLLEYLLRISGPSSVWISSFSITEVAIRTFLNLQEEGLIMDLHCLFDLSVKRHKIGLLNFANNVVSEIAVSKCHAKIILIKNEQHTITVVGSPNFTINDKKEVAVIHKEQWFFEFFFNELTTWMEAGLKIDSNDFN